MATPPVTKNLRDAEIVLFDGATPPEEILLCCEDGDLKFVVEEKAVNVFDRGAYSHSRLGDETLVKGSFSVQFREFLLQSTNPITPWEAFKLVGGAAAWTTTNDDGGDVPTIGLRFTIRSPSTSEEDERVTFAKVHADTIDFAEGDPNKLTVNFTDFETEPTIEKVPEGS